MNVEDNLSITPEEQGVYWTQWQGFLDSSMSMSVDQPLASPEAVVRNQQFFAPDSRSPTTDLSPEDTSWTAFTTPYTVDTPDGSPDMSNGKLTRRKAQNRAAQRAHRERQRVKITGLYENIEKLQRRCKQLQARNRMFETAFRRFFQDGVTLLGSKEVGCQASIVGGDDEESSQEEESAMSIWREQKPSDRKKTSNTHGG